MNIYFNFSQRNKYTQRKMVARNFKLYLGHKWTNITVGEIIRLFVIMFQISIKPQNMVVYLPCFVEDTMIHLGHGYAVQLRGL